MKKASYPYKPRSTWEGPDTSKPSLNEKPIYHCIEELINLGDLSLFQEDDNIITTKYLVQDVSPHKMAYSYYSQIAFFKIHILRMTEWGRLLEINYREKK